MLAPHAPIEILSRVVISGGEPKRHRAWPGAELAANGDLVVCYKEGTDHHITDDDVTYLSRSFDGGKTWPGKQVIAAEPGWSCGADHGLTRLSDGTLIMHITYLCHHMEGTRRIKTTRAHFIRSTDNGYHWDQLSKPFAFPFAERCWAYGKVHELSDGRIMSPCETFPVGAQNDNARTAAVAFSSDKGRTWPEASIIHADLAGKLGPNETDMLRLPDGRFLAMNRCNVVVRLYRSYSSDEGKTWTPIEDTGLPGNCPALIYLASGDILCGYRDRTVDAEGLGCAISKDMGKTWQPIGYLYRGANMDCAYPSFVRLADGNIFCAYYTAAEPAPFTGSCEIHGVFLRDKT